MYVELCPENEHKQGRCDRNKRHIRRPSLSGIESHLGVEFMRVARANDTKYQPEACREPVGGGAPVQWCFCVLNFSCGLCLVMDDLRFLCVFSKYKAMETMIS